MKIMILLGVICLFIQNFTHAQATCVGTYTGELSSDSSGTGFGEPDCSLHTPGMPSAPVFFDLSSVCGNLGPIISIQITSYDSGDGIDDPGGEDCGCVYTYDVTVNGTGGGTYNSVCDYSTINIPVDATMLTIVQRDMDEFSDLDVPIFVEFTYTLDIPFLFNNDPCNCTYGLDLDNDNINEYSREIITISGGAPSYTVPTVNGLYDNTGTLLTPATAAALLFGPDASGDYRIVAYALADNLATYDLTVEDSGGFSGSLSGGPCGVCCGANNGSTTLSINGN